MCSHAGLQLEADGERRIETRHRLLRDVGDSRTTDETELAFGQGREFGFAEQHVRGCDLCLGGKQAEHREGRLGLPGPGFADQAQRFASAQGEGDPSHHHPWPGRSGIAHAEIPDLKDVRGWLRRRLRLRGVVRGLLRMPPSGLGRHDSSAFTEHVGDTRAQQGRGRSGCPHGNAGRDDQARRNRHAGESTRQHHAPAHYRRITEAEEVEPRLESDRDPEGQRGLDHDLTPRSREAHGERRSAGHPAH